jgi:CheY-like chemotaxis protein
MDNPFALAAYRITQECLTNIAKHAGASKVDIKVEAREGFLYLSIHDNGKGLPKQISVNRHGIFGMIERARYLGGTMEIGSDDGNGTTAKLMVPLSVPNPPNIKRVLVADDHAIVRDAIRRLVDSQADDFVISGEAEDGKSAISMALEGVWDVMLLDINMPKKNGLKVLEAVKKNKPDLPVIILSSHAQEKYAEIALTKGAASYLEKDKTDQLIEEMRRVTKPDKS